MKARIIAFCSIVCIMLTSCGNNKSFNLNLNNLKTEDNIYCHVGLDWTSTAGQTQEVFGFDFGEAMTATVDQVEPSFVQDVYYPSIKIELMNTVGNSSFEFRDDNLASILFSFSGGVDEMKKFSEKVLAELEKLYLSDYEVTERTSENSETLTTIYDWVLPYGERTTHLQLMVIEKETVTNVAIGLLCSN